MSEVTIKMDEVTAEAVAEAIDTILANCDVHSDEAHLLEHLQAKLDFAVEKAIDWRTEFEEQF